MYRSTKKKFVRRISISAAVAVGALATGAGVASASSATTKGTPSSVVSSKQGTRASAATPGQDCAPRAGGVVTALSISSITITDASGASSTFAITSGTSVDKGRVSASVSDLAVGDEVRITPTAAGSTTAASIAIESPRVMGKVTAVSGDTIAVTGPQGTSETVVVSGATSYAKAGAGASLADVTVGSSIFAEGSFATASTTTLDATTVGIGIRPHQGSPGGTFRDGPVGPDGGFAPGPAGMPAK